MKKFKIIAVAVMCVALTVSLAACIALHIEDTNGEDDFSLAVITEDEIVTASRNYAATGSTYETVGDVHVITVEKFSGVWQVGRYDLTEGSATFNVEMSVKRGNCRLVLVNDGKIVHDFDINGADSYTITTVGEYYIMLAGESAEISLLKISATTANG